MKSKKILVALGTVLGIIVSSACTFAAVQMYWLTPGERNAARTALNSIDDLQNFGLIASDDADAQMKQAENAVEAARQAARTARDQDVAFDLIQYLSSIEVERETLQAQGLTQEWIASPALQDPQPGHAKQSSGTPAIRSLSLKLHETLD